METKHTLKNAETNTAQYVRIVKLLATISTLRITLGECLDFVQQKHDFDKPKNQTASLLSSIDEAIYQADEATQ
jgi:hypothetical protein